MEKEYVIYMKIHQYESKENVIPLKNVDLPECSIAFSRDEDGSTTTNISFSSWKIVISTKMRRFSDPYGYLNITGDGRGIAEGLIHREYYSTGCSGWSNRMSGGTLLKLAIVIVETKLIVRLFIVRDSCFIDVKKDFYGRPEEYPYLEYEIIELALPQHYDSIHLTKSTKREVSGEVGEDFQDILNRFD